MTRVAGVVVAAGTGGATQARRVGRAAQSDDVMRWAGLDRGPAVQPADALVGGDPLGQRALACRGQHVRAESAGVGNAHLAREALTHQHHVFAEAGGQEGGRALRGLNLLARALGPSARKELLAGVGVDLASRGARTAFATHMAFGSLGITQGKRDMRLRIRLQARCYLPRVVMQRTVLALGRASRQAGDAPGRVCQRTQAAQTGQSLIHAEWVDGGPFGAAGREFGSGGYEY